MAATASYYKISLQREDLSSFARYEKALWDRVKGLDYPYKRLQYTEDEIMAMLQRIKHLEPIFKVYPYSPSVIDTRDRAFFNETYLRGKQYEKEGKPSIIGKHEGDSYALYDVVADMFNEAPRIKSLGFAATHSSYDSWRDRKLAEGWIRHLFEQGKIELDAYELREALFSKVREARQGKPSSYVTLFSLAGKGPILDMASAYGDRMIAAIAKGHEYVGVDPWADLFDGYEAIKSFVSRDPDMKANLSHIRMIRGVSESLDLEKGRFSLVVSSPAPFDVEPYGNYSPENMKGQSYHSYPSFDDWMVNYHFMTIENAWYLMRGDALFAITILDRLAGKSKHSREEGFKEIRYTELFLLYCSCIGFTYAFMLPYEASGKAVPWWVFQKRAAIDRERQNRAIDVLRTHYGPIFDRVRPRLQLFSIGAIYPPIVLNDHSSGSSGSSGGGRGNRSRGNSRSRGSGGSDGYSFCFNLFDHHPMMRSPEYELARYITMTFLLEAVERMLERENIIIHEQRRKGDLSMHDHVEEYISDFIMAQHMFETPQADPMFPIRASFMESIYGSFEWLTLQQRSRLRSVFEEGEFKLCNRVVVGLSALMEEAVLRSNLIFNKLYRMGVSRMVRSSKKEPHMLAYTLAANDQDGQPIEPFFSCKVSHETIAHLERRYERRGDKEERDAAIFSMLFRYKALGEKTHNLTRDSSRYETLKRVSGCDFEPFASPFNAFSKYFCSVFPDVDGPFGSQGNFFHGRLCKGIYSINPVNDPELVKMTISRCMEMVRSAGSESSESLTLLVGTVTYPSEEGYREDPSYSRDIRSWYMEKGKKPYLRDMMRDPLCRGCYILNNRAFKTLDPLTYSTFVSKLVSIVSVISSHPIDMSIFREMMEASHRSIS